MKKQTTWKDEMDKLMKTSLKEWDKKAPRVKRKGLNGNISLGSKDSKVTA